MSRPTYPWSMKEAIVIEGGPNDVYLHVTTAGAVLALVNERRGLTTLVSLPHLLEAVLRLAASHPDHLTVTRLAPGDCRDVRVPDVELMKTMVRTLYAVMSTADTLKHFGTAAVEAAKTVWRRLRELEDALETLEKTLENTC